MTTSSDADTAGATRPDIAPTTTRIALAPKLDLTAAASLRTALLEARGGCVVLDGGEVRHLGAAALQVLIAARRSWDAEGRDLTLDAPSDALVSGLESMGVAVDAIAGRAGR